MNPNDRIKISCFPRNRAVIPAKVVRLKYDTYMVGKTGTIYRVDATRTRYRYASEVASVLEALGMVPKGTGETWAAERLRRIKLREQARRADEVLSLCKELGVSLNTRQTRTLNELVEAGQ